MASSHLVCMFLVTAGQNEENIGCDEEQIVVFVYLLYDTANNKVVTLQQQYVRPTADDISETVLTEECKSHTGLCEEDIRNAQSLEHVLDEFERFLRSKEIHPEQGGKPFCLCTDGPLHLRQCLHPEAFRKNMTLPSYFNRYFDLRQVFQKYYDMNSERHSSLTIKDMLNFLSIEPDQSVEYGIRHCQNMAKIIHRLVAEGHRFVDPEIIIDKLEPGICLKSDHIDDETIVKARGLPWQSSDQDIANFFRGLNIARGGVALCLSQQGRRNGEALVMFESREHRSMALRRHKHHLRQRYIEVYRATGKDFLNIAGGSSREAQMFLTRHSNDGAQVIVRMRGLPYSCKPEQVLKFFKQGPTSVDVLDGEDGILFVHQADGRATGDAFVLFASEEVAAKALTKHKESIGTRYIELFKSTTAEVLQVLNRSMDPRTPTIDSRSAHEVTILALPALQTIHGLIPAPQQIIASGSMRNCVRLRGLPLEAAVSDIVSFLGEHARDIISQGVHLIYSAEGTPSGEAFIQMDSESSAESATLSKNKKIMFVANKQRYVEVIQCSGDEMSVALQQGLLPATIQQVPNVQPSVQALQQAFWPVPPPMQSNAVSPYMAARQTLTLPPSAGQGVLMPQLVAAAPTSFTQPSYFTISANNLPHQLFTGPTHPSPTIGAMAPQFFAYPQMAATMTGRPPNAANLAQPSPMTIATTFAPTNGTPGLQQLMYWCPSPPVSPQSAYYMPTCPTTVSAKGLPFASQVPDVLAFLEGTYEIQPDVQLQRGSDGLPTGEAYLTFGTRADAERAITERNHKQLGNRLVELRMAS